MTQTTHSRVETGRNAGVGVIVSFVALGMVSLLSTYADSTSVALVGPALFLSVIVGALPLGLWTDDRKVRGSKLAGRLSAAVLAVLTWGATLGAASAGFVGSTIAPMLLGGWLAVLALTWTSLRRFKALLVVSLVLAGAFSYGAFSINSDPVTAHLNVGSLLLSGMLSPGYLTGLLVGASVTLVSSVVSTVRVLVRLSSPREVRSVTATCAGLLAWAMAGIIFVSTTSFESRSMPTDNWNFGLTGIVLFVVTGLLGFTVGGFMARDGQVSPIAGTIPALALVTLVAAGWFGFTATGLAAIPALILVLFATVFAALTGLGFATSIVRDRARLTVLIPRRHPGGYTRIRQTVQQPTEYGA